MKKIVDMNEFWLLYYQFAKRIDGEEYNSGVGFAANIFKGWLESQPDAEEKHGKWELVGYANVDFVDLIRCSNCKMEAVCDENLTIDDWKAYAKYCPNCGAKMDLGEEE